jgi:phage terminase large subunit
MITTGVFAKNIRAFNAGYRRIGNKGGTNSTKTYSILQLLLLIAEKRKENGVLISVMSETLPHLKLGAIRDFNKILKEEGMYDEKNINQTDKVYHFGNSIIEFFSADLAKATGPKRDILFVNECNNIPYSIVGEAEQRTNETIFYDFNPTSQFWFEDKVLCFPEKEVTLIKSNYLDGINVIPASIAREIQLRAERDPNYKRIHVDVEYGVYEGLIFPDFNLVDEMPEAKSAYGMDFGFTNDPSTLIDVRLHNGELWADEKLYRTAMTNGDIINFLKDEAIGRGLIIADNAEPKSIHEIKLAGFNIEACDKGKDSVIHGIDKIKSYKLNVTKRSVNLIKELRNYRWKIDKSGISLNVPIDFFNHLIDPLRYVVIKVTTPPSKAPRVLSRR